MKFENLSSVQPDIQTRFSRERMCRMKKILLHIFHLFFFFFHGESPCYNITKPACTISINCHVDKLYVEQRSDNYARIRVRVCTFVYTHLDYPS